MMPPPLDGVRVVEFGEFAAGPFCTLVLADWGADVVKIEPPSGDRLRRWPPFVNDADGTAIAANFAALNRNKRSVALDLRTPEGVLTARRLCAAAAVVVENHRPATMARLGLAYEDIAPDGGSLIYCSISGYGQTGPYARRGAFDVAIQAISGVMSVTGDPDRPPAKCGVAVADFTAGLYAAAAVNAALVQVDRTGVGGYLDCSMLSCVLGISTIQTSQYWGTGEVPGRLGSRHPQNAPYQAFRATDGYVVVAAGAQDLWERLCDLLGVNELVSDERFISQAERVRYQTDLEELLQPILEQRPVASWLETFEANGIPASPVLDYGQVLTDPHVLGSGLLVDVGLPAGGTTRGVANPVRMTGYEFETYRPPPRLGEHQREVLADWC
jgi:succinate---hydroxymethylglutarate CoA-transferase